MPHGESELPALLGGQPLFPEGPPDWPGEMLDVTAAVMATLRDGSWGRYDGPNLAALEATLAETHGLRVITCASGTLAVELALQALGVGPEDRVLLAAYDYEGNFLNIHARQARPVLLDVTPQLTIDLNQLEEACRKQPRAMIVSHLHGCLQPMQAIRALADRYGVGLIEDAAQVPGAILQGRYAGTWGDVGILSFGGSKLLSAGRGGALLTSRDSIFQRLRVILRRGVQQWSPMSELQAAALRPQWAQLFDRHRRRAEAVAWLDRSLRELPGIDRIANPVDGSPAYYKVAYRVDETTWGVSRDRLVEALRAEGIAGDAGFRALHVGRTPRRYEAFSPLTHAEAMSRSLWVLHHPVLLAGESSWQRIAHAMDRLYRNRKRLCSG
jgi:perosamine synthetase